ncbi:sugar phosphate isomerase/epimerase [Desulfovibrio sp. OttesenSCG-928-C06]|nr:sugar phosphate isomerase/epimerase [Desulfovibrio sp. OttesenSCG-928-C06]
MKFFVNLPLSWVYRDEFWLEQLFAHELNPELGLDETSVNLPLEWHKKMALRIAERGLRCSCHLPFFMVPPGTSDAREREQSADILCRAAEIAAIYNAAHMIGHPAFREAQDSDPTPGALSPGSDFGFNLCPSQQWLENSAAVWSRVMSVNHAPLFLENTHESDPVPAITLLKYLPENAGGKRAAMCFDAGHWFCFSNGWRKNDLESWLGYIVPRLGHLHLHDNDGSDDQHIGLGKGGIPYPAIFTLLTRYGAKPTVTLEPHDLDSLAASLGWLRSNTEVRDWAARL